MSADAAILPEDPALLKAMIAALQAENARMSATIRAHDQLIQTLRLRIAKLKKQAFGKSSEKVEREIEQLELALEDLLIAAAESDTTPSAEDEAAPAAPAETTAERQPRRRPRVSEATPRERRELDPGSCCPDCGGALRVATQARLRHGGRGRQRDPRHGRGAAEGPRDRATEEVLPPLREDGAGARAEPPDPGQHGERGAASLHPGLQIRRPPSPVSPGRDLRAHGMSHCAPLVQAQWRMTSPTAHWSIGAGAR